MPARTGKGARGRADAVRRGEFRPGGTPKRTGTSWLDFHEGDALDEARHAQWMPQATPLPGRSVRGHHLVPRTGRSRTIRQSVGRPAAPSQRSGHGDGTQEEDAVPAHPEPASAILPPPPAPRPSRLEEPVSRPSPPFLLPRDTTLPATTSPRSRNHCYDHSASGGKDGNTHERTRLIDGTHSPPRQARSRHSPPRPADCGFQTAGRAP